MRRDSKPSSKPSGQAARSAAAVDLVTGGDATLVSVSGLVDERFLGFGDVGAAKTVVINVSGMTRMTSFGVRQWLKAMGALPKTITELYLLGCPTFFVDQLNMVLNFGGTGKVLSVVAPHTCPSCGVESGEMIDVLAERANLAKGGLPEKECARCGGKLEFDETPESYFAFASKYAASSIQPAAAQLLASLGLYTSSSDTATEQPPKIIKLVHGAVTYFRIIGTIGSMFRARPFLVGAEGEVVIDLAEVGRFDTAGQKEWKRLLKSLAGQVPTVTLVDVNEAFLAAAGETVTLARNVTVASVLVPYSCVECGRASHESVSLERATWPLQFGELVCTRCGGSTANKLPAEALIPLQKASTTAPPASAKVIGQRDEILSRALTDAHVAQAGERATAAVAADDTILGKYKIVRRLSSGGMAEVFLAKQVGIGGFEKPVALKRIQHKLLETRQQAIELFLNEAKIAGRLMHPNIVQVLDVGEVQGALYLAMEYVHGKDLRKVIKKLQQSRTIMPLGEACHVVREVAQALHHAYWSTDMTGQRLSVVHRDISPHNIILSYDGAVKLLDFGVAMSAVTEHAETMIVGKWLYMSPETTTYDQVDHRSDLFSLGVILYLLCSGYMPFTGAEPREIVKKIRAGQYIPLHELVSVPERLALLVARMLAPNPDDRPQRGLEVALELADIARQYGIESSAANISYILKQLYPNEVGEAAEPQAPIKEVARVLADEASSLSSKEKSPVSVTPNSVSISGKSLAPVDVSETFQQRTGAMPLVPAVPDVSRGLSDTIPLSSGQAILPPEPDAARSGGPQLPQPAQYPQPRLSQPQLPQPAQYPPPQHSQPQLPQYPPPRLSPQHLAPPPPSQPQHSQPQFPQAPGSRGLSAVKISIVVVVLAALGVAAYFLGTA